MCWRILRMQTCTSADAWLVRKRGPVDVGRDVSSAFYVDAQALHRDAPFGSDL